MNAGPVPPLVPRGLRRFPVAAVQQLLRCVEARHRKRCGPHQLHQRTNRLGRVTWTSARSSDPFLFFEPFGREPRSGGCRAGPPEAKMLCHQMAAVHMAGMELLGRLEEAVRLPPEETARLTNAVARLLAHYVPRHRMQSIFSPAARRQDAES
jgi:hypothetical protein